MNIVDLRRPRRRYDYVDVGPDIYLDSFATIRREADLGAVPADAEKLAVRMIHGSGRVDLAADLVIHPGLIAAARAWRWRPARRCSATPPWSRPA
ncbi:precorrin-8X methylmutase [Nocardioides sp. B-3]|uniref:precorrin-8X methylmutase n=1 Tax=Nocardioides sp. B-3 TaxID=2895565 RepID=UPI0021534A43|nr:precorrin-8X methylmutase [Nocardioides sp. B-3]